MVVRRSSPPRRPAEAAAHPARALPCTHDGGQNRDDHRKYGRRIEEHDLGPLTSEVGGGVVPPRFVAEPQHDGVSGQVRRRLRSTAAIWSRRMPAAELTGYRAVSTRS